MWHTLTEEISSVSLRHRGLDIVEHLNLDDLNAEQRIAVVHNEGPAVVNACPGSGKTRVLTYRIAHLIRNTNVDSKRIFVTTFSNQATNEMKTRLGDMLTTQMLNQLTIGTFHALCRQILVRERHHTIDPRIPELKIIKTIEQQACIKKLLQRYPFQFTFSMGNIEGRILNKITKVKSMLQDPTFLQLTAELEEEEIFAKIYGGYEEYKRVKGVIDFDDLLTLTWELMNTQPNVLANYQARYQHVLADEAQDLNLLMFELLKLLAQPRDNLYLVGDVDQSIYGFTGAAPELMQKQISDATTYYLTVNYRSAPQILATANQLMASTWATEPKVIIPAKVTTGEVRVLFSSQSDEEYYLTSHIKTLIDKGAFYQDIAVLSRMGAPLRGVEYAMLKAAIPYRIKNTPVYQDKNIQLFVDYLRLIVNPWNDELWIDVVTGYHKDHDVALFKQQCAAELDVSYQELARGGMFSSFARYLDIMHSFSLGQPNIGDVFNMISKNHSFDLKYVRELIGANVDTTSITLDSWLKYYDKLCESREDTIRVMTIHQAKGLEWPYVYVIRMIEGYHPVDNAANFDEERRLAYVAFTRAQDGLYLLGGHILSRFIAEAGL